MHGCGAPDRVYIHACRMGVWPGAGAAIMRLLP
jgi:hypothetical protein